MGSKSSEKCASYISCTPKGVTPVFLEAPCLSSESVAVTQNKTTQPACRGDSEQVESVESTSTVGTGQIEIKSNDDAIIADLMFCKAFDCQEIQMAFLKVVGDRETDPATGEPVDVILDPNVTGVVICGVPDATDTRDQGAKNFQFTVSRTDGSNPTVKWEDFIAAGGLEGEPLLGDILDG